MTLNWQIIGIYNVLSELKLASSVENKIYKDCDTLTVLGLLAVTAGSATDFTSYMAHHKAEHFKGRNVVLLPDNDNAGYESVKK